MIKLSVIVPIYNVEAYLAECLASIFMQNIEDMEVIAIIDGSPDGSIEIARKFAAQHPNMRIIEQENIGLSATRNRGIREARGEYIAWIDSDDYYSPNALAEAYQICVDNDLDFIAMAFHQFPYEKEKAVPADGSISPVMDGREFIRYTSTHKYLAQWPSNYVHKRSFILANNLFFAEGCTFEGSPFMIKLATAANRCIFYNSPLTHYRIRDDSLSHSKMTAKVVHDILKTLLLLVDICESADISEEYMPYFSDTLCKRACFCASTYADLTEEERMEFKAMCTPRELMYFHTFVSPISYRNWLVKKHMQSAKDLSKKVEVLNSTIAAQQNVASHVTQITRPGAAGFLRSKLLGSSEITCIKQLPDAKAEEPIPLNNIYVSWLDNIVSTAAIASRYKKFFPKLYYHLLWRDGARTPISLETHSSKYGDNYNDFMAQLSDGQKYALMPTYFSERSNIRICKKGNVYLWNKEEISAQSLQSRIKNIEYECVLAEDITENHLPIHCLHDDIYLDIIVLNGKNGKAAAKVTDVYLVAKNARIDAASSGCDVYARIHEGSGVGVFGLTGGVSHRIRIAGWRKLRQTICEIVKYLAVYDGIQFRVVITANGPKIIQMSANINLPKSLNLSSEVMRLTQRLQDQKLNPAEE